MCLLTFVFVFSLLVNINEANEVISSLNTRRSISNVTEVLQKNPSLSSPEECARQCKDKETPKICYYHFTLEYYTVLGGACQLCEPNATNFFSPTCQCVLADGVEKGILTANRMIPGPSIQVCKGDKVVIDVANNIAGLDVTIHWHGIHQRGSQYYDGVPMVTQCPILEGNTFRYQWIAANAGTHFWHAHTGFQKLDGLQGSIIIRQPTSKDPNSKLYDLDSPIHVVDLTDWMHEYGAEHYPGKLASNIGQEVTSLLINGRGQTRDPFTGSMTQVSLEVFTITSGKRYRFRIINSFTTACPAHLTFQGHSLTLIAADGEPVRPVQVNTIISYSGERYDVIINADQPVNAYWIQLRGIGNCGTDHIQQLAILRYAGGPDQPATQPPTYKLGLPQGVVLNPTDGICTKPRKNAICINQLKNAQRIDQGILQKRPDIKLYLPFTFWVYHYDNLFKPQTYSLFFNGRTAYPAASVIDRISYEAAPAPPLSQPDDIPAEQFCNADNKPDNCGPHCVCTHQVDIPLNAIVEVVLVDEIQVPNLSHPFHLHGYTFNVIGMGRAADHNISKISLKQVMDLDRRGLLHRQFESPPGKDTVAVPNNGYTVFRFKADNPGYWFFHCHFLYHIVSGMNMIFHVGTQEDLPPVPSGFPQCGNFLPPINPN